MPIYVYRCSKCHHDVEKLQHVSDPPVLVCPQCGTETMHKVVSNIGIQFKGSGFYVTDNPHGSDGGGSYTGSHEHASDAGSKEPEKAAAEGKDAKINENSKDSDKKAV
ncbi:zinc ribbon domain-containing protein [bacterium]|nr:zinc ribbon domain-containing protein [bacterium]